jgi:salicylate hydroxylase
MRACYQPATGTPSPQVQWLVDAMCANLSQSHWARMQESDVLFSESEADVLYLGDSAHGMAPTLGQGATQAVEDACIASILIEREVHAGHLHPRGWLKLIGAARGERIRFAMALSLAATDTMLAGSDPVAGTRWKTQPAFLEDLRTLYCDVGA